ncbi:MAG: hypothetical protein K2U26_05880 [Cyclobacteriaceae bacterium]|nr:hypothetical protein [Cyclobacteriaceae bacterium]
MKKASVLSLLIFAVLPLAAQNQDVTPLFKEEKALDLKLAFSIKDIKKKTNDSTYLPATLYLKNASGAWDSVKIDIRARGIFRRENCYFPPIRIKADKKDTKGTLLEGNKSLKLVLPCKNNDGKNALVMKEYICYQMFEQITPYYFNTRLANLELTEIDDNKRKVTLVTAFLIEDDDLVAKRHKAKVMDNLKIPPLVLNDTCALQHDFFQYLVANTDWSTTFLHNAKLIFQEPKKYIPLAYDFDMSGFVNPPYAKVNPALGIANVRERLYRGFCRKEPVVQFVRKQILEKEPVLLGTIDQYEKDFLPRDFNDMKKYTAEFFNVLKDESQFKRNILEGCRKK